MAQDGSDTSLLGAMRPWVDAQIAAGRFTSVAEAVQVALAGLAARDKQRLAIRALVDEGLADVAAGRVHTYASEAEMLADILSES